MRDQLTRLGDESLNVSSRDTGRRPDEAKLEFEQRVGPSSISATVGSGLSAAKLVDARRGVSRAASSLLHLQRRFGNRYVQRVVALARQGAGEGEVTPDAEAAIERSRGGGQALDHSARRQMESAFGADFSGVRVHTGQEAHDLNHAVSAVAFTTGRDIFFRDGAYDPSSSSGKELLAHELTHVVQQNGAPPIAGQAQRVQVQRMCADCEKEEKKRVQGKLTVGRAEDTYEQEAARVAKEVVNSPEVMRREESPMNSATVIQRQGGPTAKGGTGTPVQPAANAPRTQTFPAGRINFTPKVTAFKEDGQGGFVTWDADFPQPPNDQFVDLSKVKGDDGKVTNGDHGFIRFSFDANWDFENPGAGLEPAKGKASLAALTPFRVPADVKKDDDKLKFSSTRFLQTSEGTGASLDNKGATGDTDDRGGTVTVSPVITYQVQTASAIQAGFNVTVLFLSEGVQQQVQSAVNETDTILKSFTASLTYKEKPVPPAPVPKSYDCKYPFGPFVVGSDRFMKEDDARQAIHDWYFDLDPRVRDDLEKGKGVLKITGRASTTGSKTFDLELAEKRAKRVRNIIADFAGSDAHLNSFALGEFAAQTGPNVEDPNERRVDVEASGQVPAEQAASVQGDGCSGGLSQPAPTGPTGPVTSPQDVPQPSASGPAPAAGGQAAPTQSAGGASSGVAEAPTGSASAAPGTSPQNFEEQEATAGQAVGAAGGQATQPAGTSDEEQSEMVPA